MGLRTRTNAIRCLIACALGSALGQTMVVPALPSIQERTGASEAGVAAIMTWFLLVGAVSTPVAARLGRKYGDRRIVLALMVLYGLGSLVATLGTMTGSLLTIVIGRVLQGVSAGVIPLSFSIIRRTAEPNRVGASIVMIASMLALGGAISLPIGGVIIDHLGVEWIFSISVLTGFGSALGVALMVPPSPCEPDVRLDIPGALLLGIGLAALLLGLAETAVVGWIAPTGGGLMLVSVAFLAAWVLYELRAASPLVNLRTFTQSVVLRTNVVTFFVGFAVFGMFFLLPLLLQIPAEGGGAGLSATEAALVAVPVAVVNFAVSPMLGRLGVRRNFRLPVVLGCAIGTLTLGLIAVAPKNVPVVAAAALIWGVSFSAGMAAISNLLVHAVDEQQTAEVAGMNIIIRNVGSAVGTQVAATVMGFVIAGGGLPVDGAAAAFGMAGIVCLVATAAALFIPKATLIPKATAQDA
ncbi:MFS transporter [Microbispora sp. H11081]|uniref:MFS transporter n=1 Tax=Microbispora sp. H11081 TaxID=2729107 RepID=UPI0028A1C769|nr:MFS transporter [Microbispora sp. H11081]